MPSGNSKGRRDTLNDAMSEPDPNDDTPLDAAAFLRLAVTDDHSSQASWSDWWRASPRAFGGQLVAHSIVAAGRCAPAGWTCHSVHVSFVGAGKMQRTTYKVTTLRKGRTLSLYQVKALEADVDVVVEHVGNINAKMKETLQQIRDSDRFCMDVLCMLLFLGMLGLFVNMLQSRQDVEEDDNSDDDDDDD